jgi:hypothetical protein
MDDTYDATLDFIVAVDEDIADERGTMGIFRRSPGEVELRSVSVPVHRLRESLVRACKTLVDVLEDVSHATTGMKLREAQVHFEVSASGGVQFVGTAEVKGTGAITLVFRE